MAGILAGLLSITLKEVGKEAGLAVVSSGTTKLFNLLTGGGTTEPDPEVRKQLDAIAKDLKKVSEDVKEIDNRISNLQLGFKTDLVQTFMTNINSLFDQYMGALAALAIATAQPKSEEKAKAFGRNRSRIVELGTRVSNETYRDLQQMHTFIAGQEKTGLLYLAFLQSLKDSKDVVLHFVKMKTFLITFYMVQQKALQLFHYVEADPKVNFTDGPTLISNINLNIDTQESYWNKIMTSNVIELATRFIQKPAENVAVDFYGSGKRGIHTGNQYTNTYFLGDQACQWSLEPLQAIDVSNLNADHFWRLREVSNGKVMLLDGSASVAVRNDFGPGGDDMSRWNLRCTETGLFQVRYSGAKYSGKAFDNWKLKVINWEGVSKLTGEANVADGEGDQASLFTIAVWK